MKLIRDIQKKNLFKFFIPALAVLFVFSLSFHNHSIEHSTSISYDSHTSSNHSAEGCSACLLQGNLQAPKTEYSFNNSDLGRLIDYSIIDSAVPNSFLTLDKPSRAPPTI